MANRFLERLEERPAARRRRRHGRPRLERGSPLADPRGSEPPRAGNRRQAARRLHPGRRRRHRDEHLRRQPPEARRQLPRGRAARDQLERRQARTRGAGDLRPRRVHRRLDRPARRGRPQRHARRTRQIFAEQAEVLEGRGVDLFAVETFFELDELEAAIGGVRSVSSLADPRDAHVRRRRGDPLRPGRQGGGASASASSAWPRSARTTARASRPRSPR